MALDKLMFVYVDENYDIKAISPVEDEMFQWKFIRFPYSKIEHFMNGSASLGQYKVVPDDKDITKFHIKSKITEISTLREINTFLSLVDTKIGTADVKLTHFPKEKKIEFRLNRNLQKQIQHENSYSSGEISVVGVPYLQFYICATDDPSFLLETLSVPTSDLITDWGVTLFYDARYDYSNAGIFTKKYFKTYSYEVINE